MKEIYKNIDQITTLCATLKVKSLFVFGSVIRNRLTPNSDIDFVVDIDDKDPFSYSDKYFELKFSLEKILQRKIDLLELQSIKNRFLRQEIDHTKLQIYGD